MTTHVKNVLLDDGVDDEADEEVEEDAEQVLEAVRVVRQVSGHALRV